MPTSLWQQTAQVHLQVLVALVVDELQHHGNAFTAFGGHHLFHADQARDPVLAGRLPKLGESGQLVLDDVCVCEGRELLNLKRKVHRFLRSGGAIF